MLSLKQHHRHLYQFGRRQLLQRGEQQQQQPCCRRYHYYNHHTSSKTRKITNEPRRRRRRSSLINEPSIVCSSIHTISGVGHYSNFPGGGSILNHQCRRHRRQHEHCLYFSTTNNSNNSNNNNTLAANNNNESNKNKFKFDKIMNGPTNNFSFGLIANLAKSSVVGTAGNTTILSTLSIGGGSSSSNSKSGGRSSSSEETSLLSSFENSFEQYIKSQSKQFVPLIVDYKERYHAIGKIPNNNRKRRDNTNQLSDSEILASRVIDRALRPLLIIPPEEESSSIDEIRLSCSVQSYSLFNNNSDENENEDDDVGVLRMDINGTNRMTKKKNKKQQRSAAKNSNISKNSNILNNNLSGHPVSLSLNTSSIMLYKSNMLQELVGCVFISLHQDTGGSYYVRIDPTPEQIENDCILELLYAGTYSGKTLMMEFTSHNKPLENDDSSTNNDPGVSERIVKRLIKFANSAIKPIIEAQQNVINLNQKMISIEEEEQEQQNQDNNNNNVDDLLGEENLIRKSLGLEPLMMETTSSSVVEARVVLEKDDDDEHEAIDQKHVKMLYEDALQFCRDKLSSSTLPRLFGYNKNDNDNTRRTPPPSTSTLTLTTSIHPIDSPLLSKSIRGKREHIIFKEIQRLLLDEFVPPDITLKEQYSQMLAVKENGEETVGEEQAITTNTKIPPIISLLAKNIHECLLKDALYNTSIQYGTRGDERLGSNSNIIGNSNNDDNNNSNDDNDNTIDDSSSRMSMMAGIRTIRPISIIVPLLPNQVHGSSLFTRGDTQVLCTVTLGAPNDGQPILSNHPYKVTKDPKGYSSYPVASVEQKQQQQSSSQHLLIDDDNNPYNDTSISPMNHMNDKYNDLPVGSLRYLRNQQALISDLNTRKVKAASEITGESGILDEVKRFFVQYDFPSYSTGSSSEKASNNNNNRRSIGHGTLAERSLQCIIKPPYEFPYSIRLNSEVTQSNGSSSMATVCGGTLALLDAGVPIYSPVAGVSVGLVMKNNNNDDSEDNDNDTSNDFDDNDENDDEQSDCSTTATAGKQDHVLLLDITGTEDHYGDMDFKIAGTENGITAFQLDVKRPVPLNILYEALDLAKDGRRTILNEMNVQSAKSSSGIISNLQPRSTLKSTAPRVEIVKFDPNRKGDLIGPGGAVLKQLEDRFGVSLDLSQDGQCLLYGANGSMVAKAKSAVMDLVADVEEGGIYEGTVIELKDFGSVIELLRNKEGLLHVSEIIPDDDNDDDDSSNNKNDRRNRKRDLHHQGNYGVVRKYLRVGQKIEVVCTAVDPVQGSISLSRKRLYNKTK